MARVIDDPSLERPPGVKAGHECATFPLGIVEIPRVSWPAAFLPCIWKTEFCAKNGLNKNERSLD